MAIVGIVPEHAYDENYGQNPIGSGRYIMKQWDKGQQVIFEANPDYYGEEPKIKKLTVLFMEEEAALGRKYLERLRDEVLRLGGICEKGVEEHIRRSIADKLTGQELEALRDSYQKRLEDRFPLTVQLPRHNEHSEMDQRDGAFLI